MSADEIIKDTLTMPTNSFDFYFLVQQIVFYVVALTVVVGCVCLCILLIKKVIRSLKKPT